MHPGSDRLEAAMHAYLQFRREGTETAEQFLSRHDALRDLLEPLLLPEADDDDAVDAPGAGRELGRYRLLRELGRGGMGVVFEARRRDGGDTPVAVKMLPAHLGLVDSAVARFRREAAVAARVRHPGLVRVHELVEDEGAHYFAMDFVAGAPLDRALLALADRDPAALSGDDLAAAVAEQCHRPLGNDGARTDGARSPWHGATWITAVLDVIEKVADALEHAHRAGVVHRDVKPSNILLCPDGRVVLTDFGLARAEGLPAVTVTGDFCGTPFYVSPEQAMAQRVEVDQRTDVFSLGVVAYELLTLQRPFAGESSREVLAAILAKEPRDPARFHRDLPADLGTIVLRALEKDPDRRYPTCAALIADLHAMATSRRIAARRPSWPARVARFARRRPLEAALMAVLAVGLPLLTGLAGYVLASRGEVAVGRETLARERLEHLLADALLLYGSEQSDEGERLLDLALAEVPDHDELVTAKAVLRFRRAGAAAAIAVLDGHPRAAGRLVDRARAMFLRVLERDAEADAIELRLGPPQLAFEAYLDTLGLSEPIGGRRERFRRAMLLAEQAVAMAPRARPVFHFGLASLARQAGDDDVARRIGPVLPVLWPDSAAAWYWSGMALEHADPEQSVRAYGESLRLQPDQWRSRYRRGGVLRGRGQLAEAIADYRAVLAVDPGHGFAHTMLCYCLHDLGDAEGLRREVAGWVALADRLTISQLGVLGIFLGQDLVPEDLRAHALPIAQLAARRSGGHPRHLAMIARALVDRGDRTAAADAARRAYEALDTHPAPMVAGERAELRAEMGRLAGIPAAGEPPSESARLDEASPHQKPPGR